jgi:DNA end-binding protein Ku
MRSIWKGSLSFGLINIPVQVYSASNSHRVELDMLHKKDLSPIRYAIMCKLEDKEIPYKDVVKGYEYEKGEYVTVTPEDFKSFSAKKSDVIEIQLFTEESDVDAIYYEKPYYLEPGKGAERAYALLREALIHTGKVALVKFILRNREHLAILRVHGTVLLLNQIRYHDEIRSDYELKIPASTKPAPKEMKMAIQLIDELTEKFQPEKYKDSYTDDLMAVINAKSKGKKKVVGKQNKKVEVSKTTDLMKELKASIDQLHKVKKGHARASK